MPKPLARKLTPQQRMEYPTIRSKPTLRYNPKTKKNIELKKIETLIAGNIATKTLPNDIYAKALLRGTVFGEHGNFEFLQHTGQKAIFKLLFEDRHTNQNILENLKGKSGIYVQGAVTQTENIGLLRKFYERIDRIAKARKMDFIYTFTVKERVWRVLENMDYVYVHGSGTSKAGYWVKFLD